MAYVLYNAASPLNEKNPFWLPIEVCLMVRDRLPVQSRLIFKDFTSKFAGEGIKYIGSLYEYRTDKAQIDYDFDRFLREFLHEGGKSFTVKIHRNLPPIKRRVYPIIHWVEAYCAIDMDNFAITVREIISPKYGVFVRYIYHDNDHGLNSFALLKKIVAASWHDGFLEWLRRTAVSCGMTERLMEICK